jgi:hypothetical protein
MPENRSLLRSEGIFAYQTKEEANLTAFGGFRQGVASAKPDQPQANAYYSYSVKFVCGKQGIDDPDLAVTVVGTYATDINIHNYNPNLQASIRKRFIPLVEGGHPVGREPNFSDTAAFDSIVLPPTTATMDDCSRIWRLLGMTPGTYIVGFLEVISTVDLSIDAVYTVQGESGNTDIDVERVQGKRLP